ncbi:hypothetical protein [Ferruginibacter sp.]
MKYTLISLIAFIIMISIRSTSCKKESTTLLKAIVTGFDARACPCCGGFMINFDGETQPYKGNFFLIDNTAAELKISATENFPINVNVDTSKSSMTCGTNFVHINKLERR